MDDNVAPGYRRSFTSWPAALEAAGYTPEHTATRRTDDERQRAVELYLSGLTLSEVAELIGCGAMSVSEWVRAAGYPTRGAEAPRRVPIDTRAAAVRRYKAGESSEDIGASLGVAATSVTAWAREAGLRVRSSHAVTPKRLIQRRASLRADLAAIDERMATLHTHRAALVAKLTDVESRLGTRQDPQRRRHRWGERQAEIIGALDSSPWPMTAAEIASRIGTSTTNVATTLRPLLERGVIEEATPTGDPAMARRGRPGRIPRTVRLAPPRETIAPVAPNL